MRPIDRYKAYRRQARRSSKGRKSKIGEKWRPCALRIKCNGSVERACPRSNLRCTNAFERDQHVSSIETSGGGHARSCVPKEASLGRRSEIPAAQNSRSSAAHK